MSASTRRRCAQALEDAAAAGADVLVLPECALTGYQFDTRDTAFAASIAVDDPRLRALGDAAAQLQVTVVVGFLERVGDTLARTAAAVLGVPTVAVTTDPQDAPPGARRRPVRDRGRSHRPGGRHAVREARRRDLLRLPLPGGLPVAGARRRGIHRGPGELVECRSPCSPSTSCRSVPIENRVFVAVADRAGHTADGRSFPGPAASLALTAPCSPHRSPPTASMQSPPRPSTLTDARTKATVFEPGEVRDRCLRPPPTRPLRIVRPRSGAAEAMRDATNAVDVERDVKVADARRCGAARRHLAPGRRRDGPDHPRAHAVRADDAFDVGPERPVLAERGYRFILQAVRGTDGSEGSQTFFAERDDSRATADWIADAAVVRTGSSEPTARATWASRSGRSRRPRRRTSTPWSSRSRRGARAGISAVRSRSS